MKAGDESLLIGQVVEDDLAFSLEELCIATAIDRDHLLALVDEGAIPVAAADLTEWRFSGTALRRARVAVRLQRDLGVNIAGIALALDLLEQVATLERELSRHR